MNPFSPRRLRSLILFPTLLVLFPFVPQPVHAQSPAGPPKPKSRPIPPQPPAVDQEQAIAYWTTETGWSSELQLRDNAANQELTVTPVLRLADGAETALAPATIKPQEVKSVDLNAAIAAASAPQLIGAYGSVALRFLSPSSGSLYASMMIRRTGHPVAFHIDATGPSDELQTGSREGVWWLPKDTTNDYLILTNHGQNMLSLDLSLYDAGGKEHRQRVLLGRYETSRFSVRKLIQSAGLAGSYGGIKVSAAAHAGSLDTLHFLFDETVGFSAILKMFDYDPQTKLQERDYAKTGVWTTRAPMLALSNPDPALDFPPGTTLLPQLFIRNTTAKPIDVALRFNWRMASATGRATGPQLHLLPYETRWINVAALQDGTTLPSQANWTSVTLTTNSNPDEIVAVAASYDATLKYGAQTPFSDQLSFKWEGGMWEYDPYHSSIITAGNGGTQPTQAAFTVFYNQGTQRYDVEQTLKPDEQMWIDVGQLIREHVPDKNGKTLPQDLTMGSYEFRDLTNKGVGTLFEGKVIYDKTYGHVVYGCGTCCGYAKTLVFYDPLGVPVPGTSGQGVNAYQNCNLDWEDVSDSFWNTWTSANTSIATVNYYATHTGVATGSTTSYASAYLDGANRPPSCPRQLKTPSGGVNVFPTISGPNTLWWFNGLSAGVSGYANQINLTASTGGTGTSFQWAITAGSNKVSLSTSTSAAVQVTSIGQSTAANDVSITVTVGGLTSSPFKLTVRAPYTLGTDPNQPAPVYSADNTFKWETDIYYRTLDNFLVAMPVSVSINEFFGPDVLDYTNENWQHMGPGCGSTNSTGDFFDQIQGVNVSQTPTPYPTPVFNGNWTGAAVYHFSQDWRVGTCQSGSGPRVQTDALQRYTDHAAHTNIVSPAP